MNLYLSTCQKNLKKTKAFELAYGKVTKIGYKFNYSDNTKIFVVTFLGYAGGNNIVGIWMQELHN